MSRRSLITFAAATLLALATTGCPKPDVVGIAEPGDPGIGAEPGKKVTTKEMLANNRRRHIAQLHAYREAKQFPKNEVLERVGNVFRDDEGHLCAVANMIARDGNTDLVDRTARTNNLIRLADVKEGELYEWVLTSGFTQEEIAMIQVPYMPPRQLSADEERERVAERLADVEQRLNDDTEMSLDVALQRYTQHRDAMRWASN